MSWSDYGNGAGECKSGATATVWFQDLALILVELTGAAKERMDLIKDASTPFYAADGTSVAVLTADDVSGMSRSRIKQNFTALKTMIASLINTARLLSPPYCHFVGPDLALIGISDLLGLGSHGTSWLPSTNILSGDAWNQIRECFDNLTKVRWKGFVEYGEWTQLTANSAEGWEGLHAWPEGTEPDLSAANYFLFACNYGAPPNVHIWNAREVLFQVDTYSGSIIRVTMSVIVEEITYTEDAISLNIGAISGSGEMTGDVSSVLAVLPGAEPFSGSGYIEVTAGLSVIYTDVSALLTYKGAE